MPLYLQSFYHPDYQTISRNTIEVKDILFYDRHTSALLAKLYFLSSFLGQPFPYDFYQTRETSIYIPFDYKPGINSLNGSLINAQTLATVITSNVYHKYVYSEVFPVPPYEEYKVGANEIAVIIINKFYCNFRDVFYAQNSIGDDIEIKNDSIYINFSFAKLITSNVSIYGGDLAIDFLVKSEKSYDYLEDFSGSLFYSNGKYYVDQGFSEEANLRIRDEFFPFIVLNNDSQKIRGKIKTNLENLQDGDLINTGQDLDNDDYVNLEPKDPPNKNQNVIVCSVSSPGYADVVYQGSFNSFQDFQICGDQQVINGDPIAIIRRDNQKKLVLYEDFTGLTSETVTIYANNFRYIKYVTLVSNTLTYSSFLDNSSIASSTVKFTNQALDLSKYYSLEEDADGNIISITFKFIVFKSSETESGALTYNLSIPVSINLPTITKGEYNFDNSQFIITTNYSSSIKYYFRDEIENIQTIAVTPTANGQNQTTAIPIDAFSKIVHINSFGFFYDFNNGTREIYKSEEFSKNLIFDAQIDSLSLEIKSGSPLTAKSFYDSNGNEVLDGSGFKKLTITPCYISSFDNYTMYIDYANNDELYFYFTFTLAVDSTSLYLQIGETSSKNLLTSGQPVSIKKNSLFSAASPNGTVNLTLWLDNKNPFVIPFKFISYSTNAPAINSVSTPVIAGGSTATATFNFSYEYADLIKYSIIDQDGIDVYPEVTLPKKPYPDLYNLFFLGSTVSQSVTTDQFVIPSTSNSLKVRVFASNLNSSFELQTVSLDSSVRTIPKKLNKDNPATIKFYSSYPSQEVSYINKDVEYYVFLQLNDADGNEILEADYPNYISVNPPPEFKAVESEDQELDLQGVSVTKINDYLYSFKISSFSSFNDSSFVIDITYSPIIDL